MDERAGSDLSNTDERLLELIREGLVDAEIAVRLGISNDDVRARTQRLTRALGVQGRDALKRPVEATGLVRGDASTPLVADAVPFPSWASPVPFSLSSVLSR